MVRRILLALTALAVASLATAQSRPIRLPGYLNDAARPKSERILPPPPPAGSGREADDRALFASTRGLAGSPRWTQATADADMSPGVSMFACAVGAPLGAADTPTLERMFRRVGRDAYEIVEPPKTLFARPRPFINVPGDPPICEPKTASLAKNPSYPSGHSTLSWAWGLILAEIAPDRATDVLMRAREIGDSRIICGVHYLSDVEEGRTNGSMLVAALHADPQFEADLARARRELAAVRAAPHPAPTGCAAIAEAEAHPPY
jgi:acid phosphatase (class A)